jgi:hypothetical protein
LSGAFSGYARPIHQPTKWERYAVHDTALLTIGYEDGSTEVLHEIAKDTNMNGKLVLDDMSSAKH